MTSEDNQDFIKSSKVLPDQTGLEDENNNASLNHVQMVCFFFRMKYPAAPCEHFIPQQTVIVSHSGIPF